MKFLEAAKTHAKLRQPFRLSVFVPRSPVVVSLLRALCRGRHRIFLLTLEPIPGCILSWEGLKASEKQLRSGEVAKATGVSTDTLRHYERLGLLPRPRRTRSNYRQYAPEAVDRVRLIQNALSVGFTLAELARVLRVRDSGGAPCQHVRALAASKLDQIDQRLRELGTMRKLLKQLIARWDERLRDTPDGQPARLLEQLPGSFPKLSRKGVGH